MRTKLLKVLIVGLVVCGVFLSVSNFVPKSYAAVESKWRYGTIDIWPCFPWQGCYIEGWLCCAGTPSNCTFGN